MARRNDPTGVAGPVGTDHSVSVREIENGYIIRQSSCDDKGNYKSSEVFSPVKPDVAIGVSLSAPDRPGRQQPSRLRVAKAMLNSRRK